MKKPPPRVRHLDVCGLDPAEPVALVLEALDQLAPAEQLCVLMEHEPFDLYRLLSNRAYAYCTRVLGASLYEVTIWHCGVLAPDRRLSFAPAAKPRAGAPMKHCRQVASARSIRPVI